MTEFNRMTIVAAAEVISSFKTHNDMGILEIQWGIDQYTSSASKSARVSSWAQVATQMNPTVMTEAGLVSLDRAMVEAAVQAPEGKKQEPEWKKFIAGLRFDGFEVVEMEREIAPRHPWSSPTIRTTMTLKRMLPEDIPGLDFREAETELEGLLREHGFDVVLGHLAQATNAFQGGHWASANGQLRTFYQGLLDGIAECLGCDANLSDDAKRQYLADEKSGPFLIHQYNEWESDRGRPAFILGLWARLHPQGSHPGLSDEDDAAFRLQITLITARLLMRRFDKRKKSA